MASETTVTRPDQSVHDELAGLMVSYQQGDAAAVEELVKRISPRILRFLAGPQISWSDAEDLLQECWIRIHHSRQSYRFPDPVLPWIFAIARHTRLDGYRRQSRRQSREVLVADPPEIPAGQRPPAEADARFYRMLESLPESQREVILMLKVSGMSLEEVARATSSTVGAIKQKAHRAYEKMRLLLEKERA